MRKCLLFNTADNVKVNKVQKRLWRYKNAYCSAALTVRKSLPGLVSLPGSTAQVGWTDLVELGLPNPVRTRHIILQLPG